MTVEIKNTCDGNGCSSSLTQDVDMDTDDYVNEYGWSVDTLNDFHYCQACVQKMINSGELEVS